MPTDPIAVHFRPPMWARPLVWWTVIVTMVAVAALSLGLVVNSRVSAEAKHRTQQLQDVICGVYVPIGNATLPHRSSSLGRTIVVATRHGALNLHCPGAR